MTNYPTETGVNHEIGAGQKLWIQPGAKATFGTLTNTGSVLLESDATAISSLITSNYSGNDAQVELYLTGGNVGGNKWHYISSPFESLDTTAFGTVTRNLAHYVESYASPEKEYGWVTFRGWIYSLLPGQTVPDATQIIDNLEPGKGFNHYHSVDHKYTLSGQLSTISVTKELEYTDPNFPNRYGFNLLGNPFSSGLDWDVITASGYPSETSTALHYTRNNDHVYYNNGLSVPDGLTGIIPPMQGFFIKTYNTSTSPKPSITLAASARVNDDIPARYKKSKSDITHLRLRLSSNSLTDNTVIRLDNDAKPGLDYNFDATKYSISTTSPSLYSIAGSYKMAINGLPFPEPDTEIAVPLGINLLSDGVHSITATSFVSFENYRVTLKDLQLNTTVDLKTAPVYSFSSLKGTILNRFVIVISDFMTNSELIQEDITAFNIYTYGGQINITTTSDLWDGKDATISLIDIAGRRLSSTANKEIRKGNMVQITAPESKGIYLIEIRSGSLRYSGKVLIR